MQCVLTSYITILFLLDYNIDATTDSDDVDDEDGDFIPSNNDSVSDSDSDSLPAHAPAPTPACASLVLPKGTSIIIANVIIDKKSMIFKGCKQKVFSSYPDIYFCSGFGNILIYLSSHLFLYFRWTMGTKRHKSFFRQACYVRKTRCNSVPRYIYLIFLGLGGVGGFTRNSF